MSFDPEQNKKNNENNENPDETNLFQTSLDKLHQRLAYVFERLDKVEEVLVSTQQNQVQPSTQPQRHFSRKSNDSNGFVDSPSQTNHAYSGSGRAALTHSISAQENLSLISSSNISNNNNDGEDWNVGSKANLDSVVSNSGSNNNASNNSNNSYSVHQIGFSSSFVRDFDKICMGSYWKSFSELSKKIGGEVKDMLPLIKKCITDQKHALSPSNTSSIQTTPSRNSSTDLFERIALITKSSIDAVQDFKDRHLTNGRYYNHVLAISEASLAFGWAASLITDPNDSQHFIENQRKCVDLYANRIIKEYKPKHNDSVHVEWVIALQGFLKDLDKFVSRTMVERSRRRLDKSEPTLTQKRSFRRSMYSAVLSINSKVEGEISQKDIGKSIDDKALAMTSPALIIEPKESQRKKRSHGKSTRAELSGHKWFIEYQSSNKNLVVEVKSSQSVFIGHCKDSFITIKGKVSTITLDKTDRTIVLFETVSGVIEVLNCRNVELNSQTTLKRIMIESTNGCKILLSKESIECDVITCKSSEISVIFPEDKNGDPVELGIPHQFKTNIVGGKLHTVPIILQ